MMELTIIFLLSVAAVAGYAIFREPLIVVAVFVAKWLWVIAMALFSKDKEKTTS